MEKPCEMLAPAVVLKCGEQQGVGVGVAVNLAPFRNSGFANHTKPPVVAGEMLPGFPFLKGPQQGHFPVGMSSVAQGPSVMRACRKTPEGLCHN